MSDFASWEMGRVGILVFVVFSLDRFPFIYKFSFLMLETMNNISVSSRFVFWGPGVRLYMYVQFHAYSHSICQFIIDLYSLLTVAEYEHL